MPLSPVLAARMCSEHVVRSANRAAQPFVLVDAAADMVGAGVLFEFSVLRAEGFVVQLHVPETDPVITMSRVLPLVCDSKSFIKATGILAKLSIKDLRTECAHVNIPTQHLVNEAAGGEVSGLQEAMRMLLFEALFALASGASGGKAAPAASTEPASAGGGDFEPNPGVLQRDASGNWAGETTTEAMAYGSCTGDWMDGSPTVGMDAESNRGWMPEDRGWTPAGYSAGLGAHVKDYAEAFSSMSGGMSDLSDWEPTESDFSSMPPQPVDAPDSPTSSGPELASLMLGGVEGDGVIACGGGVTPVLDSAAAARPGSAGTAERGGGEAMGVDSAGEESATAPAAVTPICFGWVSVVNAYPAEHTAPFEDRCAAAGVAGPLDCAAIVGEVAFVARGPDSISTKVELRALRLVADRGDGSVHEVDLPGSAYVFGNTDVHYVTRAEAMQAAIQHVTAVVPIVPARPEVDDAMVQGTALPAVIEGSPVDRLRGAAGVQLQEQAVQQREQRRAASAGSLDDEIEAAKATEALCIARGLNDTWVSVYGETGAYAPRSAVHAHSCRRLALMRASVVES